MEPLEEIPTPVAPSGIAIPMAFCCSGCSYDLVGLPAGPCPECGRKFEPPNPEDLHRIHGARQRFLREWKWWAAPGWVFTIAISAGILVAAARHGLAALAITASWLCIFALLSIPPKRRVPDTRSIEAKAYRAFWLTLVPLVHTIWSIPLALVLSLLVLPASLEQPLTDMSVLLCPVLVLLSLVLLGRIWERLFGRLAPTATRTSAQLTLLLVFGGVTGFGLYMFVVANST